MTPPASGNVETYILIANTSTFAADVAVTLLFDDGTPAVTRNYSVPAESRFNVPVREFFPEAMNKGFGAIVESLGPTPAEIVVERAIYNDADGVAWAAGNNAVATPLQSVEVSRLSTSEGASGTLVTLHGHGFTPNWL